MLNFKRATIALAFAGLSTATMLASAAGLSGTSADFGSRVPAATAERTIVLSAATKFVNVHNGETVQFKVNGQMFTWHFQTYLNESAFDLSKIAPAGVDVGHVTAYVAADPLYRS
jgi:hypothetical protein